jgi:hypothetical protein
VTDMASSPSVAAFAWTEAPRAGPLSPESTRCAKISISVYYGYRCVGSGGDWRLVSLLVFKFFSLLMRKSLLLL